MITHSIFIEFFITDVTMSGDIINQVIMHCHYHTFWELKLLINSLDILFKCVYKYLCNIVIVKFCCKSNRFLRIESIVKTLYVITKSAGGVFLIPFGVALVRVWLTCWQLWCEGFKTSIHYKLDPHWPIVIVKIYFRSLPISVPSNWRLFMFFEVPYEYIHSFRIRSFFSTGFNTRVIAHLKHSS